MNPTPLPPAAELRKDLDELKTYTRDLQKNAVKNNLAIVHMQNDIHEIKGQFREAGFIYIASPYTHPDRAKEEHRYQQVMWYVLGLLKNKNWCYSPILHCHELTKRFQLPGDAQYWLDYNYAMLRAAKQLHVLCLPGWNQSLGVAGEIAFWRNAMEKPVQFIEPDKVYVEE